MAEQDEQEEESAQCCSRFFLLKNVEMLNCLTLITGMYHFGMDMISALNGGM